MRLKTLLLFFVFVLSPALFFAQEQITITTYYPSSQGAYKRLRLSPTDDFAPGANCSAEGQIYYDNSSQSIYVCSGSIPARWVISPGQQATDAYWAASGYDPNTIYNKNSGSVGIGTNNPGVKLDLNGKLIVSGAAVFDNEWSAGNWAIGVPFAVQCGNPAMWPGSDGMHIFQSNSVGYLGIGATGQSVYFTYWTSLAEIFNFVFLPPSGFSGIGNIGIGLNTPKEKVDINGNMAVHNGSYSYYYYWTRIRSVGNYFAGGQASVIEQVSESALPAGRGLVLGFTTATGVHTPVLVVRGSGNVGIGTKEPAYQLQLSQNSAAKPTGGAWAIASDSRLKKDILPFTDGLSVDMQIRPVRYKLNGKAGMPEDAEGISVIGDEIEKVAPYTVKRFKAKLEPTDTEETELLSLDSSPLLFVMINAIKEQQVRIEKLKAQIAKLKEAR